MNKIIFFMAFLTIGFSCGDGNESDDSNIDKNVKNFPVSWYSNGIVPDATALVAYDEKCEKLNADQDSYSRGFWFISKTNIIFLDVFFPSKECSLLSDYRIRKNEKYLESGIDFSVEEPKWDIRQVVYSVEKSESEIIIKDNSDTFSEPIILKIDADLELNFDKFFDVELKNLTLKSKDKKRTIAFDIDLPGGDFVVNDVSFVESMNLSVWCSGPLGKDVGLSYGGEKSSGGFSYSNLKQGDNEISFEINSLGNEIDVNKCNLYFGVVFGRTENSRQSREFFDDDIIVSSS